VAAISLDFEAHPVRNAIVTPRKMNYSIGVSSLAYLLRLVANGADSKLCSLLSQGDLRGAAPGDEARGERSRACRQFGELKADRFTASTPTRWRGLSPSLIQTLPTFVLFRRLPLLEQFPANLLCLIGDSVFYNSEDIFVG